MKKLHYSEGSWFGVPLPRGGYAVGIIARMAPRGRIIFSYLFGPRRSALPTADELSNLSPETAVEYRRIGDLGLLNGEWPIIGVHPLWDRSKWPMMPFIRKIDLARAARIVYYSEDDPSTREREVPTPFETTGFQSDGLAGYKFAEQKLDQKIDL